MMQHTKTVAGRTWSFSHPIGWLAVRGRGLWHPTSVAVAPDGRIYILNSGGRAGAPITVTNIEEDFIGEFGEGDFTWPEGLAIDRDGNIYCADGYYHFVNVYNPDGERIAKWGAHGSELGQLNGPSGLAFDADDNLLIVDSLNGRVQRFTRDGEFVSAWGSPGSGEGQLHRPWGITIDGDGNVYIADWGNDRVQKFTADGEYIMKFGSDIDDGGQLSHPSDVAVDSEGDVYVADWGNHRVQIYYPDGDIIAGLYGDARVFSKWGMDFMDSNPDYVKAFERVDPAELVTLGNFQRPGGIVIDSEDRIIISDGIRCRLQVYTKDKDYLEPQFNL